MDLAYVVEARPFVSGYPQIASVSPTTRDSLTSNHRSTNTSSKTVSFIDLVHPRSRTDCKSKQLNICQKNKLGLAFTRAHAKREPSLCTHNIRHKQYLYFTHARTCTHPFPQNATSACTLDSAHLADTFIAPNAMTPLKPFFESQHLEAIRHSPVLHHCKGTFFFLLHYGAPEDGMVAEPSTKTASGIHIALIVLVLLFLQVLFNRVYSGYYGQRLVFEVWKDRAR